MRYPKIIDQHLPKSARRIAPVGVGLGVTPRFKVAPRGVGGGVVVGPKFAVHVVVIDVNYAVMGYEFYLEDLA